MNLYILLIVEYISTIKCFMILGYNYERTVLGLLNYNMILYLGLIFILSIGFYIINNYTQYTKNILVSKTIKVYKIYILVVIIINMINIMNVIK